MKIFSATLNQMLVLFAFMAIGYFLNKKKLISDNTSKVLSKLETYLLLPCINFRTFYNNCTKDNFIAKSKYILYGFIVLIITFAFALLISRLFTKETYLRNIYVYSFTIPNLGFMGNALVLALFGESVLFDYMMFYLTFSIFIYTYGLYSLVPKDQGSGFSFKTLLTPPLIAMFFGAAFGLLGIKLPSFITEIVSSGAACMSPLAMLIAGFVIGNYSLKKLASDYKLYIASAIRLVVIPVLVVIALKLIGTESGIVMVSLCALSLPFGLNTVVFPEAYGGDATPGAGRALISHLMALVTIPLIFAVFM